MSQFVWWLWEERGIECLLKDQKCRKNVPQPEQSRALHGQVRQLSLKIPTMCQVLGFWSLLSNGETGYGKVIVNSLLNCFEVQRALWVTSILTQSKAQGRRPRSCFVCPSAPRGRMPPKCLGLFLRASGHSAPGKAFFSGTRALTCGLSCPYLSFQLPRTWVMWTHLRGGYPPQNHTHAGRAGEAGLRRVCLQR